MDDDRGRYDGDAVMHCGLSSLAAMMEFNQLFRGTSIILFVFIAMMITTK
jgi:hypothetical protein